MTGASISIDDASGADTILSVKERVFASNRKLYVRRQRLVYRPGPRGMEALADDETLGGAGVARDGTAELDVLVEPLTEQELAELDVKVCRMRAWIFAINDFTERAVSSISLIFLSPLLAIPLKRMISLSCALFWGISIAFGSRTGWLRGRHD